MSFVDTSKKKMMSKAFWWFHARDSKLAFLFGGNDHFSSTWIRLINTFRIKLFKEKFLSNRYLNGKL